MRALKLIIKFFIIFGCVAAFAEGHEESEKGAEGAPAAKEVYSGKQDQDWEAIQTKLAAAKGKLDAQASVVAALIAEKDHLKGEALAEKIEEIKKQHQKYEQMVFDYNKENEDFLTRYPERGIKEKRVYKRMKMKSLDSFEDDVSVRGKMNKLHKKVLKQYPRALQPAENAEKPVNTQNDDKSAAEKEVTDSVKFKK